MAVSVLSKSNLKKDDILMFNFVVVKQDSKL